MALNGNSYIPKSTWIDDDDDVDDETFLRNSRKPVNNQPSQELSQLMARKEQAESRALASTERSLSMLRESEQVGSETARELAAQREQLERTSHNLDSINATLRTTQRNIDGIKSVFSSLKNYLTGPKDVPKDGGKSLGSPSPAPSPATSYQTNDIPKRIHADKPQIQPTTVQARIDQNLSLISGDITNLRGLALNLGDGILEQNDLLDRMQNKADKAEITIKTQNTQVNRLLGKK